MQLESSNKKEEDKNEAQNRTTSSNITIKETYDEKIKPKNTIR